MFSLSTTQMSVVDYTMMGIYASSKETLQNAITSVTITNSDSLHSVIKQHKSINAVLG